MKSRPPGTADFTLATISNPLWRTTGHRLEPNPTRDSQATWRRCCEAICAEEAPVPRTVVQS